MADLARESILHAFVAALVYAALVRAWRVDDPADRVGLGLVTLAVGVGWLPLLGLLAPARNTIDFREERALFDSARWNDLRVFGAGLADLVTAGFVLAGLALLLRDVLPWLRERAGRHAGPSAAGSIGLCPRLPVLLRDLSTKMGIAPPALLVVDDETPVLLCAGWRHPSLVVSRGAYERLDDAELHGAVAHELAHIERRDTTLGWLLMAIRAVFWFNPVVQVLARDLVHEIERRADDRAAAMTGERVALASSVLKIFAAGEGRTVSAAEWPVPGLDTPASVVDRFAAAVIEARCRRLLADPAPASPPALSRLRVALAGAGMIGVLFFVV